ncbi:LCP family protein [Pseudonocardia sp. GCM10023141]|uniref:LCP family glycopolymer transferase n=1 Tax=Pseudonocardia sp. GCM10023141 TaxID=3252653 RepID=UPI003613DFD9
MDDDGARVPPRRRELPPEQQPWPRRAEREQRPFPPPRTRPSETRRPLPPRRVEPSVDVPTRPVPPRRSAPPPQPVQQPGQPAAAPPPPLGEPRRRAPQEPRAPRNFPPAPEPLTRPVPRTPARGAPDRTGEERLPGGRDTGERVAPRRSATRSASGRSTLDRPRSRSTDEDGVPTTTVPKVNGRGTGAGTRRPDGPAAAAAARRRRAAATPPRTLGSALLATAAATIVPGSGHLMLRRKRTGALILGVFVLCIVGVLLLGLTSSRSELLQNALSSRVLLVAIIAIIVAALAWVTVIVRTYLIARPRGLDVGRQALGILTVTALCLVIATPLGFAANLANSQRGLLDTLFSGDKGGTAVAEAITKPRLNVLLVGSDAGPDREGTRTDSMMVASLDTKTGRTTLFGLPRNIGHAAFPPGTPMAKKFPDGFYDAADPLSGEYLLNALYAYAHTNPSLAPAGPTTDPGLNLLNESVQYMLGIQMDYYVELNMAGFASIIDALGGLTVDVGPNKIPVGGITPDGRHVAPDRYIPAGVQRLSGADSLAYARSRTDSDDYTRMGRQRCLLQNILKQKSPADLLTNFQAVAAATTDSVSTNIPQQVLPALVSLAGSETVTLESIAFTPDLPDPDANDGKFSTLDPNLDLMRKVVQDAINKAPEPAAPPATAAAPTTSTKPSSGAAKPTTKPSTTDETTATAPAAPTNLSATCG